MKQKKTNRVALLLHWAGEQKVWLFLAVLLAMTGGLCIVVPYIEIYRLMDAAFGGTCTEELVVRVVAAVAAAVVLRFVLFGASGVVSHKGAYGALFKVRCMVAEHMAKVPLGALNERRTGDIKTVLNEDIEKLELFLAHNLPDLVCYLVGPVVVFAYLMTVNIPLALISLVPLVLAVVVMAVMFRNTDDLMDRANRSITALNSVMIEYISGMKLIKAYNMGSKSFQKFSSAIHEENAMWNETSRRMGPPYAAFVVIIECGMLLMVPLGGMFFLKGSLTASAFLLFIYVGSMYLTEIRPLQELGTNFANVLNAVTKAKEILDVPIYEGGTEIGYDREVWRQNGHYLSMGVYGGYTSSRQKFDRSGHGDADTQSLGLYSLFNTDDNWFVDMVGTYFWHRQKLRSYTPAGSGVDGKYRTNSWQLSASLGKRVNFDGRWFVEPSVGLNYMHIDAVRYRTNFNTLIEASDAGYLSTRADLIAGKSFVWGDNRFLDAYGRFALIHDIDGKSKVRVADYGFAEDLSSLRYELGAGVSTAWSEDGTAYLEASAQLGSRIKLPWEINFGIQYRF